MSPATASLGRLALAAFALLAGLVVVPSTAHPCGGFFRRNTKALPSLSLERVLIIHDREAGQQHFIRQVAFRAADETFGFVVPTPARPTVAKVDKAPFDKLVRSFPFSPPKDVPRGRPGHGFGRGDGRPGGGVQVLEVSKVGSFTAFVLAAQDEKALAQWLTDNGLVSTPEADRWLAHYVRMGFYYVAMRHDSPAGGGAEKSREVIAETIRISFPAPLPYYPYLEPEPRAGAGATRERAMELWLVTNEPARPVAALTTGEGPRWVLPLREGERYGDARFQLQAILDGELAQLLPRGTLQLQTFQDQKRSRQGYGDILFIPHGKQPLDAAGRAALKPLLGIVAPALIPAPDHTSSSSPRAIGSRRRCGNLSPFALTLPTG